MKTEIKKREVTTTEEYTVYIANDGTEFKSQEECKKYDEGAICAYKTLLKDSLKPLWGSFNCNEDQNIWKNLVDDIFEDGRRECHYFIFNPKKEEDIKNFLALLEIQNSSIRGSGYDADYNPFTQKEDLKVDEDYIIIYYQGSIFYQIINTEKFTYAINRIINRTIQSQSE